jgi:hypothetical protein
MTHIKPTLNDLDLPKLEIALELAKKNRRMIHYCLSTEVGGAYIAPLNASDLVEHLIVIDKQSKETKDTRSLADLHSNE